MLPVVALPGGVRDDRDPNVAAPDPLGGEPGAATKNKTRSGATSRVNE